MNSPNLSVELMGLARRLFVPVDDPQRLFFVDNSGGKAGSSSGPPYPCFELAAKRRER